MTDYSWLKVYIKKQIEKTKNRKGYLINACEAFRDEGKLESYREILSIIKQVEEV